MELIFFSPNLRKGGGARLLGELLASAPRKSNIYLFLPSSFSLCDHLTGEVCGPGFFGRLLAEYRLALKTTGSSRVFMFNGSMPIFALRGRFVLYLHNTLLLKGFGGLNKLSILARVRLVFESWLLKVRWAGIEEIYVQTESMKRAVTEFASRNSLISRPVTLVPFMSLAAEEASQSAVRIDSGETVFFYPALFVPHKNHFGLIRAWSDFRALHPRLSCRLKLTISSTDVQLLFPGNFCCQDKDIELLGEISEVEVESHLVMSDVLIFPSYTESFGLPLIDAANRNKAIVASEADYVRDVCKPVQTFDPYSVVSIRRALERFMVVDSSDIELFEPAEVWSTLLDVKIQ